MGGGGNRGGGGWGGGNAGGGFQGRSGSGLHQGTGARTASNAPRSRPPNVQNHQFASRNMAFNHRPAYHGNWYHGDWHGHWAHPYAYRPWGWYGGGLGWGLGFGVGLGVATVGIASLGSPWGWGYYGYYNPYWVAPVGGVTYINYSQPIVVAPPIGAAPPAGYAPSGYAPPGYGPAGYVPPGYAPPAPGPSDAATRADASQERALATFDSARSFFKRGDYPMALAQTNRALALVPNDSLMHEFRALCLFAMKDYQQAAAAMHAVLSSGPGWDSATLAGLYASPDVYNQQLLALEKYRTEHPEASAARFLLAYHYMLTGHDEKAAQELQVVAQEEPNDQLAAQLLTGLATPSADQTPAAPETAPAQPVELAELVGDWRSSRPDGSKFELNLSDDNHFTWKCTQRDKQQQLAGTYTLADNYLILTARDQNALVGRVAMEPGDKLKFKLAGGSPNDPGLTFAR
jgi:hypothetical protein